MYIKKLTGFCSIQISLTLCYKTKGPDTVIFHTAEFAQQMRLDLTTCLVLLPLERIKIPPSISGKDISFATAFFCPYGIWIVT